MQPPVTRAPWAIPVLCLVAVAVGAVLTILGGGHDTGYLAVDAAVGVSYPAVGALIVTRWPRHPVGWLFIVGGAGLSLQALAGGYATFGAEQGWPGTELAVWVMNWVFLVGLGALLLLPLFVPDGRLPSPRWRPVLQALVAALGTVVVLLMFRDELWVWGEVTPNPVGFIPTDVAGPVFAAVIVALAVAGVSALAVRARAGGADARRRLLPILAAVAVIAAAVVVDALLPPESAIGIWLWVVALPLLPIATAFSIFRHRLFDLEVGVRRTVVWTVVVVVLLAAYFAVVAVCHVLFRTSDDLLGSLIATAAVAVAFAPLRDLVQRSVARYLFGDRGDPAAAISQLAQRLETAANGGELLDGAAETVAVTLRLPAARIFDADGALVSGFGGETLTAEPPSADDTTDAAAMRLPLRSAGRLEGTLVVAPRAPGERLSSADLAVLDELARPLAVALAASRLAGEVQRSRERLAIAREDERRRLRRDLHDGLGPGLAAIGMQLDVAAAIAKPELVGPLDRARSLTTSLVGEVRRIVHDLRPEALDELGLAGALEDLGLSAGGAAHVEVSVGPEVAHAELPAAVEVAAYRIAQEAIANALRHADATTIAVRLDVDEDALRLEVRDDGRGVPAGTAEGVGSGSMRERALELGGALRRRDAPGGGTIVTAELPL